MSASSVGDRLSPALMLASIVLPVSCCFHYYVEQHFFSDNMSATRPADSSNYYALGDVVFEKLHTFRVVSKWCSPLSSAHAQVPGIWN